jgi:hypothetical protein
MANLDYIYACMFYGRAGHLAEFCFRHKRMVKMRVDYAKNSYRDEFIDFPPRSYSRSLSHISFHVLSYFSHGSNHHSYGFGSSENNFVFRLFGYISRPHRGDRTPRMYGFLAGGSYTHFEPRHLNGPHFPHRGSHPTGSKTEAQKTVKTSSGRMVKC